MKPYSKPILYNFDFSILHISLIVILEFTPLNSCLLWILIAHHYYIKKPQKINLRFLFFLSVGNVPQKLSFRVRPILYEFYFIAIFSASASSRIIALSENGSFSPHTSWYVS